MAAAHPYTSSATAPTSHPVSALASYQCHACSGPHPMAREHAYLITTTNSSKSVLVGKYVLCVGIEERCSPPCSRHWRGGTR